MGVVCASTEARWGRAVKTDGWSAAWGSSIVPPPRVKDPFVATRQSPGLSRRRCCSWSTQEVPVICPENESLTIPTHNNSPYTYCALYLTSPGPRLSSDSQFWQEGQIRGLCSQAQFGVALKMSSWRQLHLVCQRLITAVASVVSPLPSGPTPQSISLPD